MNRMVRSEVYRGIYQRHCSSTQDDHFRTLAIVLNTLLHTPAAPPPSPYSTPLRIPLCSYPSSPPATIPPPH